MWPRVPRSPRARGRSSARPRRPLLVSPQLPPNVPRSEHRTACRCRRPHLTRGSPGPCPRPGCPTFRDVWKRLPWATRGGAGADPGAGTPRARGGVGARFRPAWLPQRAHGGAAGRGPPPAAPGPGTGSAEPRAPPRRGGEGPGLPVPGTPEDCRPAAWRREGRAGCPGAAAPRARREAPARPAAGFPVGTSVPRCVSVCVCGALTLPVAGTVLVPMAGLGLLLVPALLPAPPPRSFLGWGPRPCSGRALGTREPRPAGPPARRRGSVSSAPALPAGRRQGVAAAATGACRTQEPLTAAAGPVVGAAARGGPPRSTPLGRGSARARSSREVFAVRAEDREPRTLCLRGYRPALSPARTPLRGPRRTRGWWAGRLWPTGPSLSASRSPRLFPALACSRITRNRAAYCTSLNSTTRKRPESERFLVTNYHLYI